MLGCLLPLSIVYPFMQSAFDTVGIIAFKSSKSLAEKVGRKKSLTYVFWLMEMNSSLIHAGTWMFRVFLWDLRNTQHRH